MSESAGSLLELDEVCALITDGTHYSPPTSAAGPFLYITSKNIREGRVDLSDVSYVDETVHAKIYAGCPVRKGDVLFVKDGVNTGTATLNTLIEPFSMLSSVALLRPRSDKLDPGYLVHWLNSPLGRLCMMRNMSGSAIRRLVLREIRRAVIPTPSLSEQQRTAKILDRAEALRANRRAALAQLDTLTQSIFLDLFGDPATNPNGWQLSTIGGVSEQVTDGEHLTPKRTTEGIKLLSARNIRDGYLDFQDVDHVGPEEHARIKRRCNPSFGDILISCSGTIGRVAPVETNESFSLVRSVALVRPKTSIVESKFLEHYLRTPTLKARMLRRANASSQANLFQGQIRELPVYLPPVSRQQDFARSAA